MLLNDEWLLRQQLPPAIRSVSGDFFTFQQDSAPAHRARETVALLSAETPDFISPQDWPPNRPDLNPVDYAILGFCTNESTAPRSVTSTIWKNDWLKSGVDLIRTLLTVNQWRDRLRKCVRTKGGHVLWTSDLNSLVVLTDIDCAGNSWLVSSVI